ncbi:MAG TPA: M56 family metallopeptidase [Longimicrobium sp.]|nr:M56 family metallopeptidase [Longimicrobium sp.]
MVHWMAYCLAVGVLISAAALAMEAALRAFRRPARWVWAAALALSIGIPAAVRWVPRTSAPPASALVGVVPLISGTASSASAAPVPAARPEIDLRALDRPLLVGWAGLSIGVALAWLAAWGMLQWRRRTWRERKVGGVRVLVSAETGPAVVGWIHGRIVLPEWVVRDADPSVRRMILQHETEHLAAGDPRMLAFALAAAALVPWSPAAWWQLRRLRLAMEVDCDARVLARRADVRAYGELLLEVGRRGAGTRLPVAAMSEPRSFLERRIRMITQTSSPRRVRTALSRALLFVGAMGATAALPLPAVPAFRAQNEAATPAHGDTVRARMTNARQVQRAFDNLVVRPALARGDTGSVSVEMHVTATGGVSETVVTRSSHPRYAAPARQAMGLARFRPATVNGEAVPASVAMTFLFGSEVTLHEGDTAGGVQPAHAPDPVHLSASEILERYYPDVLEHGPGQEGSFVFILSPAGQVIAHSRSATPAVPQNPWERESVRALLERSGLRREQMQSSMGISSISSTDLGSVPIQVVLLRVKGPDSPGSAAAPRN